MDRAQFLRLGAVGAGAGLAFGPVAAVVAQTPAPEEESDDLGIVHFSAVAELVSIDFFRAVRRSPELAGPVRRRAGAVRDEKIRQLHALNGLLGDDKILADDFAVTIPKRDLASRPRIAALGVRIERILVGALLDGIPHVEDRRVGRLVARLLAYESQQLAWMRELRGAANPTRPPAPMSLERAGTELDRFLSIPGVEPK